LRPRTSDRIDGTVDEDRRGNVAPGSVRSTLRYSSSVVAPTRVQFAAGKRGFSGLEASIALRAARAETSVYHR
jgi:hypothetical protein